MNLPARLPLDDHSIEGDANNDEELLVNVEHQVLEVRIDTRLRVDRCLLIGKQVIELDNSNRDGLKLLGFKHYLLEERIFNDLICNNRGEVAGFCHVPPVIAVQRSVQIVA